MCKMYFMSGKSKVKFPFSQFFLYLVPPFSYSFFFNWYLHFPTVFSLFGTLFSCSCSCCAACFSASAHSNQTSLYGGGNNWYTDWPVNNKSSSFMWDLNVSLPYIIDWTIPLCSTSLQPFIQYFIQVLFIHTTSRSIDMSY